jgi:hypothetical protein
LGSNRFLWDRGLALRHPIRIFFYIGLGNALRIVA